MAASSGSDHHAVAFDFAGDMVLVDVRDCPLSDLVPLESSAYASCRAGEDRSPALTF